MRNNRKPKRRNKISVVRDQDRTPDPVSTLSLEEQARMLTLADVALHNRKADDNSPSRAGDRAHLDHERLKNELQVAVERFEQETRKIG